MHRHFGPSRRRGWVVPLVLAGVLTACSSTPASVPTRTASVVTSAAVTTDPPPSATTAVSVTTSSSTTPATATTAPFVLKVRHGPSGDAFYRPPVPLPVAPPGTVIWASSLDAAPTGAKGYRVLYHSTSVAGADIAVSGLLWVPGQRAPGAPLLSYAHAPSGLGDECAPSKSGGNGEAADLAAPFLAQGYIVVATDYEGLGPPGVHPYAVGVSEGRGVLDMIRAGRQLTETIGSSVVWGHSQGGGAALFAAELEQTYAPDTRLIGAVAGAPTVELSSLLAVLRPTPFFGYVFQVAAGFRAAYPDVDLTKVFTPKGLTEVDVAARGCFEVNDDVRGKNASDYIKADLSSVEPLATHIEDNTPGNLPTKVPIFVYQGEQDEQIPVTASFLMLQRACRRGGFTILRTTYPGESHLSVITVAEPAVQAWIVDRFAGKPAPSSPCPPG